MRIPAVIRLKSLKALRSVSLCGVRDELFSAEHNRDMDLFYVPALSVVIAEKAGRQSVLPISMVQTMHPVNKIQLPIEEVTAPLKPLRPRVQKVKRKSGNGQ